MIETPLVPGHIGVGVADHAIRGETGSLMIGVFGILVIGLMAAIAFRRGTPVASVRVALCAIESSMWAHKRIPRGVVIERRPGPGGRIVAIRAVRREAGCPMIRCFRVVVIRLVAGKTIGRRALVAAVRMAEVAGDGTMGTGQRESRGIVIECPGFPIRCRVTLLTGGRKARCGMVRCLRAIVIILVTGVAIGWSSLIATVRVALTAGCRLMRACQRIDLVSERGIAPGCRAMAGRAICRKSRALVIGVGRIPVIPGMAGVAFGNSGLEIERRVTPVTGDGLMCAGQAKSGFGVVIPVGGRPTEWRVAATAFQAESSSVWIILLAHPVTGLTVPWCVLCIPSRVAFFAWSHEVFPGQGEIGCMRDVCIEREFPCVRLVAELAARSKATFVRIRMAARAGPIDRRIVIVGMAGCAVIEFGMAACQGETGDGVFE